jgi:hypothetical protein
VHTFTAQVVSAVTGATATGLLALLVSILRGIRKDIKRFMAEHLWLLAVADWSSRSIVRLMRDLGIDYEPPPDWPGRKQ